MSLHTTFSIITKSITDSPAVTTLSFQHGLFNQKCTSASLDCPYNTIRTGVPIRPPPQTPKPPAPSSPTEPPIPVPQPPPQAPPNPPGGKLLV